MKYSEAITKSHTKMLSSDKGIILGQGISDFKGMWGTTIEIFKKYPNKVIDTPIAEDSIAGICVGLALNGFYPINTHIRADFSLLIFNQLVNLIAKYRYMYGGNFHLPMLFRLVIGRSWGQGAQHSQSLQSMLAHIPGLTVIMPSNAASLYNSYTYAFKKFKNPIISFEHRLLYDLNFNLNSNLNNKTPLDTFIAKKGNAVTVIATSIMVLESIRAAEYLEKYGIKIEVIDLHNVSNPNFNLILKSIKKTQLLIVADTSWTHYGVASEISRIILEKNHSILRKNQINLGMAFCTCPTAKKLEDLFYPGMYEIIFNVLKLLDNKDIPLPPKQSMTDYYKYFKGPF